MKNFILIGMPASGKSTLGKALAIKLNYSFLDTDKLIIDTYKKDLMTLIDELGTEGFIKAEGQELKTIDTSNTVISTGGSAIYSKEAMYYLKKQGAVVYLKHNLNEIAERVGNLLTRGVVCRNCNTLEELFRQRLPFYEEYADITVNLTGCSILECNMRLYKAVKNYIMGLAE